jgi:hypothetical protein
MHAKRKVTFTFKYDIRKGEGFLWMIFTRKEA